MSIKDGILSSLKHLKEQTWYNLQHPDMDSQFRLDIALQLLTIVDWVHMVVGPDQCTLYKEAEKVNIHIMRPQFYSPLPTLSQLPNQPDSINTGIKVLIGTKMSVWNHTSLNQYHITIDDYYKKYLSETFLMHNCVAFSFQQRAVSFWSL